MSAILPWYARWALLAVGLAVFGTFCYVKGEHREQDRQAAAQVEQDRLDAQLRQRVQDVIHADASRLEDLRHAVQAATARGAVVQQREVVRLRGFDAACYVSADGVRGAADEVDALNAALRGQPVGEVPASGVDRAGGIDATQ